MVWTQGELGFLFVFFLCCLKGPEVNMTAVSPSYKKYIYFFPTLYLQQMVVDEGA